MSEKIAVVTGASSGIGLELARRLAAQGYDLWLVARREDRLQSLAAEISSGYGKAADLMRLDLTMDNDRRVLAARMQAERAGLGLVVNNAGFGSVGATTSVSMERYREMIELNITAVTDLSLEAARIMVPKHSGGIINVASTASFQPVPYMNVYSATKAFVSNFTISLAEELKGSGVRVMALSPGFTATEFQQVAGVKRDDFHTRHAMSAAECARIGLEDFARGKVVSIPGMMNKVQVFGSWLFPRSLVVRTAAMMMKNRSVPRAG